MYVIFALISQLFKYVIFLSHNILLKSGYAIML